MTSEYKWSLPETIEKLNKNPFGKKLASKVAAKLVARGMKKGLCENHRDYCGHGLFFDGKNFILCPVWDAVPVKAIITWKKENDFIDFLSEQSDFSMSGADKKIKELYDSDPWYLNNQRITRKRLEEYAGRA